jgi:hypothetical protein
MFWIILTLILLIFIFGWWSIPIIIFVILAICLFGESANKENPNFENSTRTNERNASYCPRRKSVKTKKNKRHKSDLSSSRDLHRELSGDRFFNKSWGDGAVDLSNRDPLFEEAARLIVAQQMASTSLMQQKFVIGYNRAGRLMDQLEVAGVVGSFDGNKLRQVLVQNESQLEQILNSFHETNQNLAGEIRIKYESGTPYRLQQDTPSPSVCQGSVSMITPNAELAIIDITPDANLHASTGTKEQIVDVPYWGHYYVYSCSEINRASHEQKQFYFRFKNRFLEGECLDLNGNTNYAFILLYDLLSDYDRHRDIVKLEKQLKLLGQHYPKTKSYANSFLIQRMKNKGDNEGAERIWEEDHDYWKLGSKYRNELQLNREEVKHLNDLYYTYTKFNGLGFCMTEIVKIYCSVISELKNKYARDGTTLDLAIKSVGDLIIQKRYGTRKDKYYVQSIVKELYTFIFKHCENAIREHYRCVPKLNINLTSAGENEIAYNAEVISTAIEQIAKFVYNTSPIDEEQERILNYNYPNRWKKRIKEFKENYNKSKDAGQFYNELARVGYMSESIFYEATIFMLKCDSKTAIKLYFHYLDSIFRNHKIVTEKRLCLLIIDQNWENAIKTVKKDYPVLSQIYELNIKIIDNLLKRQEQIQIFKDILAKFVKNKDLNEALDCIPDIYRKKIQVENRMIAKIQQQHSESVALLNEYLRDESEDENNIAVDITGIKNDGIASDLQIADNAPLADASDIEFSQIQLATLFLFTENNLSVLQGDVEAFARSKGIMKNQLVESINELCYELLDDVLIEDEDAYYTINPDYYQKVLTK